jgi:predicted RNase H-like HicB family nuclease
VRQVILIPNEMGGYTVEVPSLPGCNTQGTTREEALENARDAIEGYVEALKQDGLLVPDDVPGPILVMRVDVDEEGK